MEYLDLGGIRSVSEEISWQALAASLFHGGCQSIAWSREMMRMMDLVPYWGTVKFEPVAVSVEQLGFSQVASFPKIIRRGEEKGLARCLSRTGPLLVARGDLPPDKTFLVAMNPIEGGNGAGIFEIRKGYLGARHAEPNVYWSKDTLFVFSLAGT